MFLANRRRICAVAALTLGAILNPVTAHSDHWIGTRYNGNACNGYRLTLSVFQYGGHYPDAFRTAIDEWHEVATDPDVDARVMAPGMIERSSWIPGTDNCFVGIDRRKELEGITRSYGRTSGGVIYPLPDDLTHNEQNWFMCTISLYDNVIQNEADKFFPGDDQYLYEVCLSTAVHEMGHSLKLAHAGQFDDVSYYDATHITEGDGRSVMGGFFDVNFQWRRDFIPTEYDRRSIARLWGHGGVD